MLPEILSIAVCNTKGGVGKSTVASNVAALFATRGWRTTLVDCDAQQSCSDWLARRAQGPPRAPITGVDGHSATGLLAPAVRLRVPPDTEVIVYDAPAGVSPGGVSDLLRRARILLVPLLPSPVDLQATEAFAEQLSRTREIRGGATRALLLPNRVRDRYRSTSALRKALPALGLPSLCELSDSQLYVFASGHGLAVHELRGDRVAEHRRVWEQIHGVLCTLAGLPERAMKPGDWPRPARETPPRGTVRRPLSGTGPGPPTRD